MSYTAVRWQVVVSRSGRVRWRAWRLWWLLFWREIARGESLTVEEAEKSAATACGSRSYGRWL